MVVGVEPFFHWEGAYVTFFPLVAAGEGEVLVQFAQVNGLHLLRYDIEEDRSVQEGIVEGEVITWDLVHAAFLGQAPVFSAEFLSSRLKLFSADFLTEVFFSSKF